MGEGDSSSGVIVIFFFFLFLIAFNSCVHSCPGLIKGLGLANVIIGVLISLTGVGSVIGFPMILCGSILLCCCDDRREVHPGHRD
jgi:hypothetical protein